jgi:hypothetical protein
MADTAVVAGFVRGADAMLRALGGATVTLRIAVAGGPTDGLGLAPPLVEEIALALSASAIRTAVEERALETADALFAIALGLMQAGRELRILSVHSDSFAGTPYLFRLVATE